MSGILAIGSHLLHEVMTYLEEGDLGCASSVCMDFHTACEQAHDFVYERGMQLREYNHMTQNVRALGMQTGATEDIDVDEETLQAAFNDSFTEAALAEVSRAEQRGMLAAMALFLTSREQKQDSIKKVQAANYQVNIDATTQLISVYGNARMNMSEEEVMVQVVSRTMPLAEREVQLDNTAMSESKDNEEFLKQAVALGRQALGWTEDRT